MPVAVVELACLRLREHLVGLDHLAEALLRVRSLGDVGVQSAREAAERLLDLASVRGARHAEELVVVVLGRRHLPRSVAPALVVLVELLDEARQLVRGGPDRADRLVVVHTYRAQQRHGTQRPSGEAVGGADEREVVQRRVLQLGADADERPARVERLAQDLEQRCTLLEYLEQALVTLELLAPEILEQAGRAPDVEALLLGGERLGEERAQRLEKRSLARAERRLVEPPPQDVA